MCVYITIKDNENVTYHEETKACILCTQTNIVDKRTAVCTHTVCVKQFDQIRTTSLTQLSLFAVCLISAFVLIFYSFFVRT